MKTILRRGFLVPLLACAVALGCLAGDVRSEDDKPETKGAAAKAEAPFVQVASGPLRLKEGHRNAIRVELGKDLSATGHISITDWFGAKAVSGQVNVANKTDGTIHTAVSLILFDKAGKPLGCAAQDMSADPGEETVWGGFVIKLPSAQLAAVHAYTYIWYEDDRPIGRR